MGLTDEQRRQLDDKLAPLVESWIRAAQAAAWDEGFNAGEQDVLEHKRLDDWDSECIRNPYRDV